MADREKIPSGYLVRAKRTGSLILGGTIGIWATNSIALAASFGDDLELVRMPIKVKSGLDPVTEANYFRRANDRIQSVDELTPKDWNIIKKYWHSKGYDAINFGPMHKDNADDVWIFDRDIERKPFPT